MKKRNSHERPDAEISTELLAAIRGGNDRYAGTGTTSTRDGGGDDDPGTIVIIDRDGP